jgi:flagellar biosynthesis protein FliP
MAHAAGNSLTSCWKEKPDSHGVLGPLMLELEQRIHRAAELCENRQLMFWWRMVIFFTLAIIAIAAMFSVGGVAAAQTGVPSLNINLSESDDPTAVVPAIKIVSILTILSVAPAILLMMTSFTRILVVLSFLRQAIGTATMPPNQVLLGLSLFLTMFTMAPVWQPINDRVIEPLAHKAITQEQALAEIAKPVRKFMLAETREADLGLFMSLSKIEKPKKIEDIAFSVLIPAFMISELKTAFQIGFLIYIPFLVIDMVVSAVLMAMGMMMLPPTVVSLPFKLVLFVLVDGWSLIVGALVKSFHTYAG